MASTSISIQATSSSCSPPQWMYDVFLSFRGKDTRNNFTSHLYSNLVQRGIDVYMDDRELERGKTIEPALWKAIEDSRFSVVVFSRDYVSSPWCLDELVKIVQCMKEMGHTVLPVFYDVDPSEVAEQKGNYKEPFVEHEQNFRKKLKNVQSWKDCLTTVANLSGWDVRNRNESESIKKIVEYIQYKLSVTLPIISKKLVGIDSRLKVLNGYIGEEANGILFIGIYGMGGMGKTTLARVIHDSLRWQFEGSCFLANVREVFIEKDGSRRLQEQLLSEILMEHVNVWDYSRGIDLIKRRLQLKKVLLILDDVDDQKQLEMLAVEHRWFGPGSRIIITTRNKNVLDKLGVTRIYEVDKLNEDDALMLFCWKAFKKDQPVEDFWEMSKKVVGYANGLPLALEVIGSFLHSRGILEWESAINRMNDIPDREIIDVLRISFDGLHELEKKIFLDIACFFKGMKKDRITRILDSCGFYSNIGIQVLIEKSLISVSRDEIWMHNLLQKMGQEIVRREFPEEPGRRSRLWAYKDVCNALKHSTGKIESIFVDRPRVEEAQWNMKAFSKMSKLRLLKIRNVQLSEGPEYLSNELRFLEWHAYPSKSLPACLQLDMLVELDMSYSSIEQLGHGFKSSANLKIINLSHSIHLTKTPDFTGIPNLESLNLEACTSLSEVHPSFGRHKKLQLVNLVNCNSLRILPSKLEMESLKLCTLDGCSKLEMFPDIVGNMNSLRELRLDGTSIVELPLSIRRFVGLGQLSMNNCKSLRSIPSCISALKSLKKIDLSGCSQLKSIPESLGRVESLKEVDVSGTSIRQLPVSIFLLKNLKVLSFDGCTRIGVNLADKVLPSLSGLCSLEVLDLCDCNIGDGAVPEDIGRLTSLRSLDLSKNNFVSLPNTLNHLSRLEIILLEDCRMLESLPEVPSKVQTVNLNGCIHLKEVPDPIKLSSSKISEFKCFNCWNLCKHNRQENIGLIMLKRYLQGKSNPRPGFGIVVPGNEILGCFKHQSKGSSIRVQVPCNNLVGDDSGWMGFVACVVFTACGGSPSLLCHFKVNGRENYPSPMCISCNSIPVLSDHLWLFCLSFDHLKELKEWKNESFSTIELLFHSYDQGVKLKNCGVTLVHSAYTLSFQLCSARLLVTSKETASLASTSSYRGWMRDVFHIFSVTGESSNNFTHLYTALVQKGLIQNDKELEKLKAVESRLLDAMEELGLSITIFGRDIAYSRWWLDELVKIVNFMSKMTSDTVFPLFHEVELSKIDEQIKCYSIVIDKYEEDFSIDEKVQRWINIYSKVTTSFELGSSESGSRSQDMELNASVFGVVDQVFDFEVPDLSTASDSDPSSILGSSPELANQQQVQQPIITLICQAAELIETGNPVLAQGILARLNHQLSLPIGKPYQRTAFYFKVALQLLLNMNNNSIAPACNLISKIAAYKSFTEISPIVQFANFTCNQALLEAFEGFERIHIVDFDIGYGEQWASLMQELALRNGGAPSLKITAFASPSSHDELELGFTQENLRIFASEINMPFELEILSLESLSSGSWPMPLHLSDKAVNAVNLPVGSFSSYPSTLPLVLVFVKQLSPKVVVSLCRGCDRSDLPFGLHVNHAIKSYSSLLESLDAVKANSDALLKIERLLVQPGIEKIVLGRHRCPDRTLPWKNLFLLSGFTPLTFSNFTESQAEYLVRRTGISGFHVEKRQSSLVLCWQLKDLVSASAWRC